MADTRTANISKLVLKQAGRAKEKILQNLGKADKTTDEIFEEHLQNFNSQQVNATRLHKDINNYLRCIKAMQTASKNLMETLSDIYEKEWVGQDMLYVQAQNHEMLWADLAHKLSDQVVIPLNTYQAQFPEMRKKIDKRGRKLIDFDKERHAVQQMQNNPNRNEAKFIKVKEQMENAKRTYEVLNSELHDELPALHDSRILFLVTNMQTLFAAEEVFHSETSKTFSELEAVVDKLAKEVQKGTLPRRTFPKPQPISNSVISHNNSSQNSTLNPPKDVDTATEVVVSPNSFKKLMDFSSGVVSHVKSFYNPSLWETKIPHQISDAAPKSKSDIVIDDEDTEPSKPSQNLDNTGVVTPDNNNDCDKKLVTELEKEPEIVKTLLPAAAVTETSNGHSSVRGKYGGYTPTKDYEPVGGDRNSDVNSSRLNGNTRPDMYQIPAGASTDNLPPGVLYKVKATYKYQAEDMDELSFEVGEIIDVMEYDDPEEQEEGWLCGAKESTGQKGLFPANFTKPI